MARIPWLSTRQLAKQLNVRVRVRVQLSWNPRCTGCLRTGTSSPLRAYRCTIPSTRRSPCSANPKSTKRRCEAIRFRGVLVQNGILTPAQADEISSRVANEMQEAVTFALNSPFPKLESALEYN